MKRDNQQLTFDLEESTIKIKNYEEVIEKYKGIAVSIGDELTSTKIHKKDKDESAETIKELRSMIIELREENDQLLNQNQELKNSQHDNQYWFINI